MQPRRHSRPRARRAPGCSRTAGDRVVLLHREPPPTAGAALGAGDGRRRAAWPARRCPPRCRPSTVDGAAGGPAHRDGGRRLAGPARDAGRRHARRSTSPSTSRSPTRRPRETPTPTRHARPRRRPATDTRDRLRRARRPRRRHAEPTATPTPTPAMIAKLDGRWCDASALCDHRLGFTFAQGEPRLPLGRRPGDRRRRPFGTREVSAPVDTGVAADARAREPSARAATRCSPAGRSRCATGSARTARSTTQALAFSADGSIGFTGGTIALGAATTAPRPAFDDTPVPSLGDALVAAAASPNGDGRVFAISRQGAALVYAPERGWTFPDTGLAPAMSNGATCSCGRSPGRARTSWSASAAPGRWSPSLRDPVPFDLRPRLPTTRAAPSRPTTACRWRRRCWPSRATPPVPLKCTAVGRVGLIVRGDGLQLARRAPA